jgi:Bacteriocin-protection, YdeI or OmpD-Associated
MYNFNSSLTDMRSKDLVFFSNRSEFRSWLHKNHKKEKSINLGFYKKSYEETNFSFIDAKEESICFGWNSMKRKKENLVTFSVLFVPRGKNSIWGHTIVAAYKKLKAAGLVKPAGELAYQQRKDTALGILKPMLSKKQLALFKSNKKAWIFFESRSVAYRDGVFRWILDAKQEKTRVQRIKLVATASEKSELIGYWKKVQEKSQQPKITEGPIPIESAKNIGPKRGMDLRSLGIETLGQLQNEGWEEVAIKAIELYPEICTPGFLKAIAGAATDQKVKSLDAGIRSAVKSLSLEARKYRNQRR